MSALLIIGCGVAVYILLCVLIFGHMAAKAPLDIPPSWSSSATDPADAWADELALLDWPTPTDCVGGDDLAASPCRDVEGRPIGPRRSRR